MNRRPQACKARALPAELQPRWLAALALANVPPGRVGQGRLELPTSRLSGVRSNHLSYWPGYFCSGAGRDRTDDLRLAKPALSQLSYSPNRLDHQRQAVGFGELSQQPNGQKPQGQSPSPIVRRPVRSAAIEDRDSVRTNNHSPKRMVGPGRLELPTSRLSGVRSNHLSYGPILGKARTQHSLDANDKRAWFVSL